jgi:hypothetical protein
MNANNDTQKAKSLRIDKSDEWVIERRPVSIEIEELGGNVRPEILVCASPRTGMVMGASVIEPGAPDSEISSWAVECVLRPMIGKPHRPGRVELVGNLESLVPVLEGLDIEVRAGQAPHPLVDDIISELEKSLSGPEMPPYITGSRPAPALVGEFFQATADFYALQPWSLFDYEIPAKVDVRTDTSVTYWAVVMGVGGQEFGLSMFHSSDDLLRMYDTETEEEAVQVAENTSTLGFTFDDFDSIGPVAQEECLTHGWALPDPSVYPSALAIDPKSKDQVRRPNETELVHLTAAILALKEFLKEHLKQIRDEECVEDSSIQVKVSGKPVSVTITMPAPEFLEDDEGD